MKAQIILTEPQQAAANRLLESLDTGNVVVLRGAAGSGKTTILENIHETRGGVLLGARQFVGVAKSMSPAAIEESFLRMVEEAILSHDLVLADDLQVLLNVVDNPRSYLLDAALTAILAEAGFWLVSWCSRWRTPRPGRSSGGRGWRGSRSRHWLEYLRLCRFGFPNPMCARRCRWRN